MSNPEKKHMGHLRRLQRQAKRKGDTEGTAALRWAIYKLGQENNCTKALRSVVAAMADQSAAAGDFPDARTVAEQAQRKVDRMSGLLLDLRDQEDQAIAEDLTHAAAALVDAIRREIEGGRSGH